MKGRLVLFLVLYYILTSVRWSFAQRDCEFYYSEQPPVSLSCDPYEQRELKMECTVHGPVRAEFDLVWFSAVLGPGGAGDTVRLQEILGDNPPVSMMQNSSNVTIRFQFNQVGAVKSIRSRLELQLNREISAYDTAFWCSVLARPINATDDGGTGSNSPRALPSEVFILRVAEVYTELPVCGSTPQSVERQKCATVISPSLEQPAATPSHTYLTTQTQDYSVMFATSSYGPSVVPSSSGIVMPTMVPSEPPLEDLNEGHTGLNAIVFPILGVLTGAFCTLSLVACLYLWCHYRQKKNGEVARKRTVEATFHTYSSPSTLSSYQMKGLSRMGRGGSLVFCPSSTSLPLAQRARSHRLEEPQDASACSHDQYMEMAGVKCQRTASHSSCPTLQRTGGAPASLSECGSMKLGFSYEVPVPFHLEPEYASIPTPYIPYLVPVPCSLESGLQNRNSRVYRQPSTRSHREVYVGTGSVVPQLHHPSMSAPPSPTSHHDYEELIHTTDNKAYRELKVAADKRDSGCYTALVPLPQPSTRTDYTLLHNCTQEK